MKIIKLTVLIICLFNLAVRSGYANHPLCPDGDDININLEKDDNMDLLRSTGLISFAKQNGQGFVLRLKPSGKNWGELARLITTVRELQKFIKPSVLPKAIGEKIAWFSPRFAMKLPNETFTFCSYYLHSKTTPEVPIIDFELILLDEPTFQKFLELKEMLKEHPGAAVPMGKILNEHSKI